MKSLPLLLLLLCSCASSNKGTKISAPVDILPRVNAHLGSIPPCWTKQKIAGVRENHSSLTVKKQPATEGKTVPIFIHNGQKVGGYQRGGCGKGSVIVIAAFSSGKTDDRVLRHEICHHLDDQGPCLGGHHASLAKGGCCPFWPYLTVSSFEAPVKDGEMEVEILSDGESQMACIERKTGDITESAIIFPDISVSAVEVYDEMQDEVFWLGLRKMAED